VTAAKAVFTDNEDYLKATADGADADTAPDELTQGEPSLEFVAPATDSTAQDIVSANSSCVTAAGADVACAGPPVLKRTRFFAAALSDSGTCWYVQEISGPANIPATVAGLRWAKEDTGGGDCSSADAPAPNAVPVPPAAPAAGEWAKKPGDAIDIP
jgi:hypothetical protein